MARKTKTFELGDLVRYTAKFRRSTGMVAGGPVDGVVVGHSTALQGAPIILWSHRSVPIAVASANVEKKRTKTTRDELLNATRVATGLPIGRSGQYRLYVGPPKRWDKRAEFDGKQEALSEATRVYDLGAGNTVLIDPDGAVIMALDAYYAASNPGQPKSRKRNTHDPVEAAERASIKIEEAEEKLEAAAKSIHKRKFQASLQSLFDALVLIGAARDSAFYGKPALTKELDDRIGSLETARDSWARTFIREIRKPGASGSKKKPSAPRRRT